MKFIYLLLKAILKPALRLYHRRTIILGKKHLKHHGPCILLSNHPATLLDPLNAAAIMPRQVHFLANAGLFATPFGKWFFSTFFCIPVQRYEDTGGKPLNNTQSFAAAQKFLASGGCLFIAAEGTSIPVKHLRKLKTGLARIGLSTENEHHFKLGLVVQPIGLNYDNTRKFRPRLTAIIGPPFPFAPFQEMYAEKPREAVRAFTQALHQHTSQLLLNSKSPEEEKLLQIAHEILQNEKPLQPKQDLKRSRKLLNNWHQLEQENSEKQAAFRQMLLHYANQLKKWRINDLSLMQKRPHPLQLLKLSAGAPLALYGWLNNLLPVSTVCRLSKHLKPDASFEPTYKFVISLLAFPLFYCLQTLAFAKWSPLNINLNGYELSHWIYLLSLIPSGIFFEKYIATAQNFIKQIRYRRLLTRQPNAAAELQLLRAEIKKQLLI